MDIHQVLMSPNWTGQQIMQLAKVRVAKTRLAGTSLSNIDGYSKNNVFLVYAQG